MLDACVTKYVGLGSFVAKSGGDMIKIALFIAGYSRMEFGLASMVRIQQQIDGAADKS